MRPARLLIVATALLISSVGCMHRERRIPMTTAATLPAASGSAKIGKDKNGNTTVDLKVEHLADPQKLTPPKTVYVVWIQPRGDQAKNMGALTVNQDLSARFTTVTPYKDFDLFVTAEDGPTVTSPSGPEVMRQHVSR